MGVTRCCMAACKGGLGILGGCSAIYPENLFSA